MAQVVLKQINKRYDEVHAVKDVNLNIHDKEFVVLVGPSGCGKTTTLRMVAGLEEITAGEIVIGDRVVNDLPPKDRDIAMVFQNYALYPHMTVYDNMAFGLKMRKFAKTEIEKRVQEAADLLGIRELLKRKPRQLSGGQRQRVAVGRAIVRHPQVFLFDEPLSNLDAKLRGQVRTEIKRLHQAVGTTIIYVTHDQVEAMTLADRIVILKGGEIEQVGTPDQVYNSPNSVFVGGFIGSPAMNFAKATVRGGQLIFEDGAVLPLDGRGKAGSAEGREVILGIRPEHFGAHAGGSTLSGRVQVVEPLGSDTLVHFSVGASTLTARVVPEMRPQPGEVISMGLDPSRLHLFDATTERALT